MTPVNREKHFLVSRVIVPEDGSPITQVDLQAVHSQRTETISWRELDNATVWVVGWK
ncbi:hypothetical protein IMCC9480_2984 [Oxalobacteraceae bacterium IMCC9480]|nr:hypothetical protein IMCC9480_2984 [Oxalobacteraceae bacterium IMCC9480]